VDFGVSNPTAILWAQIRGSDIIVFDEFIAPEMHSKMVKAMIHRYPVIAACCDPSGTQKTVTTGTSIVDELKSMDQDGKGALNVITPRARVIDRIDCVHTFLGKDKEERHLFFDRTHTIMTQMALKGYRYPRRRKEAGDSPEIPYKDGVFDHPMDALGYGCLALRNVIKAGYQAGAIGGAVV